MKLSWTTAVICFLVLAVVATGQLTSVAATTLVYTFGINYGQALGDGGVSSIYVPKRTKFSADLGPFVAVEAEEGRSFALTEGGVVYAVGSNTAGRGGLGDLNFSEVITPIDATNLAGQRVIDIDAGNFHTLIATEGGQLFAFGLNGNGRTGQEVSAGSTRIATPVTSPDLAGKWVTQVSAGWDHSLALADDGTVVAFGRGTYGQTGLGTEALSLLQATAINLSSLGGRTVKHVEAGNEYSLLLTEDGAVFSFGRNSNGKSGLGTANERTLVPTQIDQTHVAGKRFTQIAAGGFHSLYLADDGSVYSSGWNLFGQTGLNTTVGNTLIPTPVDLSPLAGRTVTQIAAGWDYSLLLTNDGTVFSFGRNDNGRTGNGLTSGNTLLPTQIAMSGLGGFEASFVAAGENHNLVIVTVPEPGSVYLVAIAFVVGFRLGRRRFR